MGERLSALDAAYLAGESSEYLTDVRLLVFPGPRPGFEAFLDHVRERLPEAPRLSERVCRSRLELLTPRWERDPAFEVERHVSRLSIADGGGDSALESVSAQLMNQPMDLRRPLWDLTYIEGLSDDRFGAALRCHHALGDGRSNNRLLTRLFPPISDAEEEVAGAPVAAKALPPQPSGVDGATVGPAVPGTALLGRRLASLVHPRRIRRSVRRRLRRLGILAALARRPALGPRPLADGPMSPEKRVALLSVPLGELRKARTALGATVNTLLVAALAGALRRHFVRRGESPVELTASIAVSVRDPRDDRLGNRARDFWCRLPVVEGDAGERLRLLSESLSRSIAITRAAGQRREVVGPQAWRDFLARHRFQEPPFDVVVTNPGGHNSPLRCCGQLAERLLESGPNTRFRGPVVRVSSYLDSVTVAVTTDPGQRVDGGVLARDLHASLQELLALAHSTGAPGNPKQNHPRSGSSQTRHDGSESSWSSAGQRTMPDRGTSQPASRSK